MKKVLMLFICFVLLTGCYSEEDLVDLKQREVIPTENTEESTETTEPKVQTPEEIVEEMIREMTLEEKVAQLLIVDFYTFTGVGSLQSCDENLLSRLQEIPVGGFIFFKDNLGNGEEITTMIDTLQEHSEIPLWISVDEEGGKVSRLQNDVDLNMTKTPEATIIGKTLDGSKAYETAKVMGSEMNALGFNMDFAPVADVNTNSKNVVIGARAFHSDPYKVAEMVINMQKGFLETGIVPVEKHFPGHGDTENDTHNGTVYVEHDMERLVSTELIPFQQAIDAGAKSMMVAHISLPNVTGNNDPATLSYSIITELLREKMGFNGVVITDSLGMGAITNVYSSDVAAVKAIQAGVDQLLMPEDIDLAIQGILNGVEEGTITEERINESVKRILLLKYEMQLFDPLRHKEPISVIGSDEHQAIIDGLFE